MKRSWRAAAIWDLGLIGVPLVAALLAIWLLGWPPGVVRGLLLAVFAGEVFFLLVPPTFYGAGGGWNSGGMGGSYGASSMPTYEGFEAAVNQKRTDAVRRTALDPAAIGPAVAFALLALTLTVWH